MFLPVSMSSRARLVPLLWLVISAAAPAAAVPEVRVEQRGDLYAIHAEVAVVADAMVAWQVLTDYNHLAEFVPDLHLSRIISPPGRPVQLEQRGNAGFLLFKFALEVVLEVDESPPLRLGFRAIRGNMRQMRGEWRIEKSVGSPHLILVYAAELEPSFWVPPLIGTMVMRRDVANQIAGVVREIERRHKAVNRHLKSDQ